MPNQRLVRVHELMVLVITKMTHFLWLTISGNTKIVKRKRLGWQRHEVGKNDCVLLKLLDERTIAKNGNFGNFRGFGMMFSHAKKRNRCELMYAVCSRVLDSHRCSIVDAISSVLFYSLHPDFLRYALVRLCFHEL